MSLPQQGLGRRIAAYRKLNGWTAEKLAEEAGAGMTRAILAQLESGRRESLSIAQFMAVCLALGIPPAALLVDATRPIEPVELPPALHLDDGREPVAGDLLLWLSGGGDLDSELPSARKWKRLRDLLGNYFVNLENVLAELSSMFKRSPGEWAQQVQQARAARRRVADELRAEGVELDEDRA